MQVQELMDKTGNVKGCTELFYKAWPWTWLFFFWQPLVGFVWKGYWRFKKLNVVSREVSVSSPHWLELFCSTCPEEHLTIYCLYFGAVINFCICLDFFPCVIASVKTESSIGTEAPEVQIHLFVIVVLLSVFLLFLDLIHDKLFESGCRGFTDPEYEASAQQNFLEYSLYLNLPVL